MISFEPTEEQQMMQRAVADFARQTLAPRTREMEALRGVPEDIRRMGHEMGLGLSAVPETCGGQGLGLMTAVMIEEELGAADAGAAFGLAGPGAFGRAVLELCDGERAEALLEGFDAEDGWNRFGAVGWSEASPCRAYEGFETLAERTTEGYRLTGKKSFVGNAALADRFVVFAQVEPARGWNGIGAFVVRRDNPSVSSSETRGATKTNGSGLRVLERHKTLGLDAASFGEIVLEDVLVRDADRLVGDGSEEGFSRAMLRFFAKQALVVAARAVGLSRFAFELSREHCDTRVAFGKPIGHFQAVAFTLADRAMDVETSRWLVWKAAAAWDAGLPEREALLATARAGAHVLEAAMRTTDDCVQLFGGAGFIRDLVAEKLMRDAKQLMLATPTAEQLDQLASAIELGQKLDPALVLPTPDTQAIFT